MSGHFDVVAVGAGQAGLGAAKLLMDAGLEVVVLEKGRIGETWLSQRWERFSLNTPNWLNGLPGASYGGDDPEGFSTHLELVESFEDYVRRFELDVRTGVTVVRVAAVDEETGFVVEGDSAQGPVSMTCSNVVVASGINTAPRLPDAAAGIPPDVLQLSTGTYRSPSQLPEGAVLVVGGGQSGGQIVEDLLDSGRAVYYSISRVGRVPRRYRGKDFMDWMAVLGDWEVATADAEPQMLHMRNPLTSGVGPRGHTVSFQDLHARGARLMGRLEDVRDGVVTTDGNGPEYVQFSDEISQFVKDEIDSHIAETGTEAPPPEIDTADATASGDIEFSTKLDLRAEDVNTVIWCTGFMSDFSWIELPVTDEHGIPQHDRGASNVPGLYFIGFPWLSKRKSGVIYGIEDDAANITDWISARMGTG